MAGTSWTCPFCGKPTTITNNDIHESSDHMSISNKYGGKLLETIWIVCPNDECKEYVLYVMLHDYIWNGNTGKYHKKEIKRWNLVPQASVKVFPDYVPQVILNDYKEACLIKDLSPKASATLARRCLQGLIRGVWKVKEKNLKREIDKIKTKVDPLTWEAIDAVRGIGNIGAHMEKDINFIVDVEPEEATKLINLIEILIQQWYVNEHEKKKMMQEIIDTNAKKKQQKKEGQAEEQRIEQKETT